MFKSGYIGIIGSPNAGKSTFLNKLLDSKIAITSDKIGTTRNLIKGIYTDDESQIVFIDTPGYIDPKNKLQVHMNNKVEEALVSVDIIFYIVDAKIGIRQKEEEIITKIAEVKDVIKIACINKIDLISQEKALHLVNKLNTMEIFNEVTATSFKESDELFSFVSLFKQYLSSNGLVYTDAEVVDFSEKFYVEEIIREKVIRNTYQEVPHGIYVEVTELVKKKKIYISAIIYVERNSQKGIIIGKKASMLKQIGIYARKDLEYYFNKRVHLDLLVRVSENWTNKRYEFIER